MLAVVYFVLLIALWWCWGWIGRMIFTGTTLFAGFAWLLFQAGANDPANDEMHALASRMLWVYLVVLAVLSALRYRSRRRSAEAYLDAAYEAGYQDGGS